MYLNYTKRLIDIIASALALVVLSPLIIVLIVVGAIVMRGNPFFTQPRPGKKDSAGTEKIFRLIKLRTMTNARDANGELLADELRLSHYGRWLRSTSADELPSLLNILKGDMSLVGPRPQLARDMVFMTPEQRRRHDVTPGLTGLAQINGRNNITWEQKLAYDLEYIDAGITLRGDLAIIIKTFGKVLKKADIVREGTVSDMDFGDWLLLHDNVTKEEYDIRQQEARRILDNL